MWSLRLLLPSCLAVLAALVGLWMLLGGHLLRGALTAACAIPVCAGLYARSAVKARG